MWFTTDNKHQIIVTFFSKYQTTIFHESRFHSDVIIDQPSEAMLINKFQILGLFYKSHHVSWLYWETENCFFECGKAKEKLQKSGEKVIKKCI